MRAAVLVFLLVTILSGCAKSADMDCPQVPQDQRGSFMALVQSFPLTLTADETFNSEEREDIEDAVADWNAVGQEEAGHDLFDLNFGAIPQSYRSVDPHSCSQDLGDATSFVMVRESNLEHWQSMGFTSLVPGATIRCAAGGFVTGQIIYVFPQVVPQGAMLHVFAHELGHSMGLDHSCSQSSNTPEFIGCGELDQESPYRTALMYPWVQPDLIFGSSRGAGRVTAVADPIQANDSNRASCLLK